MSLTTQHHYHSTFRRIKSMSFTAQSNIKDIYFFESAVFPTLTVRANRAVHGDYGQRWSGLPSAAKKVWRIKPIAAEPFGLKAFFSARRSSQISGERRCGGSRKRSIQRVLTRIGIVLRYFLTDQFRLRRAARFARLTARRRRKHRNCGRTDMFGRI